MSGAGDKATGDLVHCLVDLYTAWDKAEPGQGYDARAASWKSKLSKEATPPREKK